jgi:two-component system OmpR family response regulator
MSLRLQRILYVEDEPDIQAVARLALEAVGGYTVDIASSGEAALSSVASVQPDLLLLDVMMPGMDGPATLRALRALPVAADLPAIFMTARVQPHEVAALMAEGAIGVIAKPFDPMQLAQQVRQLWSQHGQDGAA